MSPGGRKTLDAQIADEQHKADETRARIAALKARQRTVSRKVDTHRKIIVGGACMAHTKIDPQFRKALIAALNAAVTDKKHRTAIPDLLDEQAFAEAMRAAAKQAASDAKEAGAKKKAAEGKRPPA